MDAYDEIEKRYGFSLPKNYRAMDCDGWFDAKNVEGYLWIPEAEWLTPHEILNYQFQPFHKSGFVPFAFTGAGDLWCWWPREDPCAVVMCWRDSMIGNFDAPSLVGSVYRRILEYCTDFEEAEVNEVREKLRQWTERLSTYVPSSWIDTLGALSARKPVSWQKNKIRGSGLLSLHEAGSLIKRDLDFPRLYEEFEWMNPS